MASQALARLESTPLSMFNIAHFYERACVELEETARKKGRSVLAAGFYEAGIVPFDPSKTLVHTKTGDARAGVTAEQIAAGKKRGELAGTLLREQLEKAVVSGLQGRKSELAMALEPLGAVAKAERLAAFGKRKAGYDPLDVSLQTVEGFIGRLCPTSMQYVAAKKRKLEDNVAKDAEKAEKAEKAAADRAQKLRDKDERSKATQARIAANKAKRAQEALAKAARKAARKAAKPPAACARPADGRLPAQKAVRRPMGDPYARAYRAKK